MGFTFIENLIRTKKKKFKIFNIDTYPSQLLIYPHIKCSRNVRYHHLILTNYQKLT
jgi:hypothetical protein